MKTPPADLLVYFAPQPDCKLQVIDRTAEDPRTAACAGQVRYLWEGNTIPGQQLLFTQVYYPHRPFRFSANTNNPGAKAVYSGGDFEATACASGIEVINDTVETTVMKFTFEPNRVEWAVFNPKGNSISEGPIKTDASYAYINVVKDEVVSLSATNATFISLDDKELFRQQTRGIFQK